MRALAQSQSALWCACGNERVGESGLCPTCERRERLSREHFGGLRALTLQRDGFACLGCGEPNFFCLLVHHRRRGVQSLRLFATLCRACHNRVHHSYQPAFFSPFLRALWREQHPGLAEQIELGLYGLTVASAAPLVQIPLFFEAAA